MRANQGVEGWVVGTIFGGMSTRVKVVECIEGMVVWRGNWCHRTVLIVCSAGDTMQGSSSSHSVHCVMDEPSRV